MNRNKENEQKFKELFNHAQIANEEMAIVKTRLGSLEKLVWFTVRQNWAIILTIISAIIAIFIKR